MIINSKKYAENNNITDNAYISLNSLNVKINIINKKRISLMILFFINNVIIK